MANLSEAVKYLGPLTTHAHIAAVCDFGERVWEIYRQLATEHGPIKHGSREYLLLRKSSARRGPQKHAL